VLALEALKPWVGIMIAEALQRLEPTFEDNPSDRDNVTNRCRADFWEYVTFIQQKHTKVEQNETETKNEFFPEIWASFIKETESNAEIIQFVDSFVSRWWKKYKDRVKILLEKPKTDILAVKGERMMYDLFLPNEVQEICNELTLEFLRWGEICMPRELAKSLFMRTLGQLTTKKMTIGEKLNFLSNLKREAKKVSYVHGCLLFISPSKEYFLREYRFDGESSATVK